MAITIDWLNYIIEIPRADMTLIQSSPSEIRQLNINDFRLELRDIEDSPAGMPQPVTHDHNPPSTISGVTLARQVTVLDPYTLEFEDGQYNVNIVGGNSNIADVTIKNQVGVNTANSAGLQDPFALQAAGFVTAAAVAVDPSTANNGTTFPIGTRAFPVNNMADALSIAQSRGLYEFNILGDITIDSGDFSSGFRFRGDSEVTCAITLGSAAVLDQCEFQDATITGTLDGDNSFTQCSIGNINYFNGTIHQCAIAGTITTGGTNTVAIYDSWSGVAGGGVGQTPIINIGGTNDLIIRNYNGGIEIEGCTADIDASIDMGSGRVVFDSTVTDGDFYVRGVADVFDYSTGSATVTDQTINTTLVSITNLIQQVKQSVTNVFASIWAKS